MTYYPQCCRLVLQDLLRPLREILLRDDLQRRLLLGEAVLDEKDNSEGSNAKQVSHTEHLCEAIQLFALGRSIFVQE